MLHTVLLFIHFICAFSIVALVLLQRGKGADAGAGFGAGASGTVFGARGATTALSRATAIMAGIFMLTSLSLAYVGAKKTAPSSALFEQLQKAPTSGTSTPPAGAITITPAAPTSAAPAPTTVPSAPAATPAAPGGSSGAPK